ncbi:MAG: hypothetical protein M3Y53_10200 [Thermoproteota archaeon]|nr:hypothetical protein [Thermoproteota archaeon]
MNKILLMTGITALAAILLVPLLPYAVNASSNCSAQGQDNDKSGSHSNGISASSQNGSCSTSLTSRAGQGSSHFSNAFAFSDPGLSTASCTSTSGGNHFGADDGQSSGDGSCSASSHSP